MILTRVLLSIENHSIVHLMVFLRAFQVEYIRFQPGLSHLENMQGLLGLEFYGHTGVRALQPHWPLHNILELSSDMVFLQGLHIHH